MSKIEHILSIIHYKICGAVSFSLPISLMMIVLLSSSNRKYELYPLFRVRSWNNGVRCMSFYILMVMFIFYGIFLRNDDFYTPAQRSWRGGILDSPCPSVCPSVCRWHGFRSISQVCFGISISNFICMLMVVIGKSLLIFSEVTFKMAAWWPYWIFWFPGFEYQLQTGISMRSRGKNT